MTDSFSHEFTLTSCDASGKAVGDIDLKIEYVVSSWGAPARINFNEHDCPAEGPELDVVHVQMLNAPKSGSKSVYVDAWDWLYDQAGGWADAHIGELIAIASLDLEGRRWDAYMDAKYDAQREARS